MGEHLLGRLNGMFAFALWDPRRRAVFIARDRLGEKPLHLCRRADEIWFASEIKSLLAADAAELRPDHDHLFAFLAFGDLGHPTRTPISGIEQLPAGHAAWITPGDGPRIEQWRYWDIRQSPSGGGLAEFQDLFRSAVEFRLRSDVPLGTSLSGGLDSSLVLGTVRSLRPERELHAFTASFAGTAADELPHAQAVAGRLGVTIHPVPLFASDLSAGLDAMIQANEGPVESPSTFAQFRVMQEAHDAGITVLLDGQGADETWAGYEKYVGAAVLDDVVRGHVSDGRRRAQQWHAIRGSWPRPLVEQYAALVLGPHIRARLQPLMVRSRSPWLSPEYIRARARVDVLEGTVVGRPIVGRVADTWMELDLDRITLPRLLRYADRNSMAWSREVRLPFLDHRLVELATSLPIDDKVGKGWSKEPVRQMLEGMDLGQIGRRRDKVAYMPPTGAWLDSLTMTDRVQTAWTELHDAGLLASTRPLDSALVRWRVLALHVWADSTGISLR